MEDRKKILNRILSNIPDRYDKSDGLFLYDFSKATAIEFENKNKEIQEVADKLDVENLYGEELERFIYQRTGIVRKKATKATTVVTITGQEGAKISKGDLAGADTVNFTSTEDKVIDYTGKVTVLVECEEYGTIGNVPEGAIKYFPVSIPGLVTVTNLESVTNGYNAESDESLLERYYERIRTPATSGNKYHYLNWAKEVIGVGDAKVIPLWNGNGTVKVVIVDSNKNPATEELVQKVHEHIEEERPVGATVTVVSAVAKNIGVSAKVSLAEGYRIQLVQDEFKKALEQYRRDIAFKDSYVSYAAIGNILFNVDGVLDYIELKLNGEMKNITLADEEIPIVNNVDLEVI